MDPPDRPLRSSPLHAREVRRAPSETHSSPPAGWNPRHGTSHPNAPARSSRPSPGRQARPQIPVRSSGRGHTSAQPPDDPGRVAPNPFAERPEPVPWSSLGAWVVFWTINNPDPPQIFHGRHPDPASLGSLPGDRPVKSDQPKGRLSLRQGSRCPENAPPKTPDPRSKTLPGTVTPTDPPRVSSGHLLSWEVPILGGLGELDAPGRNLGRGTGPTGPCRRQPWACPLP